MPNEFIPNNVGNKNCDGPVIGTPHPNFDYIHRSTSGDDVYPIDACPRYLQVNGKFDNLQVTQDVNVTGTVTASSFTGNLNGTASGNKLFDIPHVTKKGKRIRHIIAEGPEPGIYVRGKLKDSNIIELPEYWDGLIDSETITVTLTQIGCSQDLIIDKIECGKKVIIRSGVGANIHCYYEVWAARWLNPMNHDEKFIVVYDGETPDDYPGDNSQFLIGGWDYDRRNPQWEPLDTTRKLC